MLSQALFHGVKDKSQDIPADRAVGDMELLQPVVDPVSGFGLSVLSSGGPVQDSVELVEGIVSVIDGESSVASKHEIDVAELSIDSQEAINLGLESGEFAAVSGDMSGSDDDFVVCSILSGPVGLVIGHVPVEVAGVETISDHPGSDMFDEPIIIFGLVGLANIIKFLNLFHVEPLSFGKKTFILFNVTNDHIEHVGLSLQGANLSGDLELLSDNLLRLGFVDDSASFDTDLVTGVLSDSQSVHSTITEEGHA